MILSDFEALIIDGKVEYKKNDSFLHVYGRLSDGTSATIVTNAGKYYFYAKKTALSLKIIEEDRWKFSIIRRKACQMKDKNKVVECLYCEFRSSSVMNAIKNIFIKLKIPVWNADLPIFLKSWYDRDYNTVWKGKGIKVWNEEKKEWFINLKQLDNKAYTTDIKATIFSFDIENDIESGKIYCISWLYDDRSGKKTKTGCIHNDSEKEILKSFYNTLIENNPDVISGYNIIGHDIPHIIKRCIKHKLEAYLKWGRDGTPISIRPNPVITKSSVRCVGRFAIDVWHQVKKHLRPQREKLGYVSQKYLGETKIDFDPTQIRKDWAERKDLIIKYCQKDTLLSHKLLLYIKSAEMTRDLSIAAKVPLQITSRSAVSVLIDSLVIRICNDRHILIPPAERKHDDDEQIPGGYVKSVQPGVYPWVCCFDFKSMYPATVIKDNICHTTFDAKTKTFTKEYEGVMPHLLKKLMRTREKYKLEKTSQGDSMSYAVKILMNSFYGVLLSPFYRFNDKYIGSEITRRGRECIYSVIKFCKDQGINVIYGDTDSLFINFGNAYNQNMKSVLKAGKEFIAKCGELTMGLELEFECIYSSFFSHGKKKKYAALKVWPSRDTVYKGYEIVRTDSFAYLQKALREIFDLLFDYRIDDAKSFARKKIKDLYQNRIELDDIVISKSCQRFSQYKNPDSMQQVIAAKILIKAGEDFSPGMKVSWIISNDKSQCIAPIIRGKYLSKNYNVDYYVKRVAKSFGRILGPLGLSEEELLGKSEKISRKGSILDLLKSNKVPRKKLNSSQSLDELL